LATAPRSANLAHDTLSIAPRRRVRNAFPWGILRVGSFPVELRQGQRPASDSNHRTVGAVVHRGEKLGLGRVGEAGGKPAGHQRALHGAQEGAVQLGEAQAFEIESVTRSVGERHLSPVEIDVADEEARLLHLDLAAKAPYLHHVLPLLGEVADGDIELLANPPIRDRLPLVGPAAVVVEDESEGLERRRTRTPARP